MNITLLCTDENHPVNKYIYQWIDRNREEHDISLVRRRHDLKGGDILFLISCSEIISKKQRALYCESLVLHASALPKGRGWSPHIWSLIDGACEITISLLDAEDSIDSGRIWHQKCISISPGALWNEINESLFAAEFDLIDYAINHFDNIVPREQDCNITPTYYRRRTAVDSEIDPHESIASQFNKIRVCDPFRFPAYFDLHGHHYKVTIEKIIE